MSLLFVLPQVLFVVMSCELISTSKELEEDESSIWTHTQT